MIINLRGVCHEIFERGEGPSIHCPGLMTLVRSSGRAAAAGLKPLRLPRAPDDNASVLPPTLVRSLPIACAWSRSLSFFFLSALVCDLLPRRLFDGFRERCIARRVSQSQF